MTLLITGYQKTLGLFIGGNCRFYPSCSVFAQLAFCRLGLLKGSFVVLKRLLSCHPWHRGGVDFPPQEPRA